MTSSLVGSEMCIRDRMRSEWDGTGSWIDLCRRTIGYWPRFPGKWAVWGCLLYTSDAADDM
eukprot:2575018-Prorocentrum_lima.AAC.1